jgi:murein DD-endopeptidase MepM/ murein hydrolase activator NlpD
VDWHTILDANPGLDPLDLQPGQVILIPREPALVKVSPDRQPRVVQPERPPRNPGYPGPLAAERTFAWPLRGTIIVRFGRTVSWRMGERNQGVDIRAKPGQVVSAAKSGRVSTFTDFPGYGRVIVLEHRDGTVTFYGHLDELLIDHGRWAKQGERIATAGSTGRSSGTELHFRVMRGSTLIDPVKHLPR